MNDDWKLDAELLDRWRAGDNHAGERLYDRHVGAVTRFFRNKVQADVDDLVQQTFLGLVGSKARIRAGIAFRAFVLGVARNVLGKHLRKLGRGRSVDPEVDSMAELAPGPTTLACRRQEHGLLLDGLRRLPIAYQQALELYYWEGLNSRQIAEVMGVTESAARGRLSRGRAMLNEAMAALTSSAALLTSTVNGLEGWVEEIRGSMR